MKATTTKPFLTIAEVAALLQVSTRTIRRKIEADELPAHRLGRIWRVSRVDLGMFMARRRQGSSRYDL
jgi:excisionase family DNA binding protein